MATHPNRFLDLTDDKPPRVRRWIPVSLRTFAAILVLLGIWGGLSAYRRVAAIERIRHFNGDVQWLHERSPEWLFRWLGEERTEWFDDPDHVIFWPDEENLRRRRYYSGRFPMTNGPTVDDDAIKCVLGLPKIKSLSLALSSVGDAAVEHVSHLQYLEDLRLDGSDVSDLSVPILSQMRSLKRLNVEHTKITRSGSRALEAALPGCDVQGPHNSW